MKRKEIFLVVILILFGLAYSFFNSEDFSILESCGGDARSLLDKNHPHEFSVRGNDFENISKIILRNPAGNISFERSKDNRVTVNAVKMIFHRHADKAVEIKSEIEIATRVVDETLEIGVETSGRFPYRRARIHFLVSLPQGVALDVFNRYGNLQLIDGGDRIKIDEQYGDIAARDIFSDLSIVHGYGRITLNNLGGNTEINTRYSSLKIYNAHFLKIEGRYTGVQIIGLEKGITLKNSHEAVEISDVKGDMSLDTRHCRIKLLNIDSNLLSIGNSFADVSIENLWSAKTDISVSHGNLYLNYFDIRERLNIRNRYSNIRMAFSPSIVPHFQISLDYGQINNRTPIVLKTSGGEKRQLYSNEEGSPEIVVENRYGDVLLENAGQLN